MKSEATISEPYIFSPKNLFASNNIYSILTGIYVFTWFTQLTKRIDILNAIRFEFLLGASLTLLAILTIAKRQEKVANSGLGVAAIAIIAYFGIFAIFTYDDVSSHNAYIDRVLKYALVAIFFYAFIDNIYKLAFVLLCYFLATAKLGQEGLLGWLTGNLVWQNQGVPKLHGSVDRYGHPNSFSGFAVCLLPFIYCFYPLMNKYMKAGLIFLTICAAVIILFTGSRTGYIAASLFLFYALIKTFKKSFFKFAFILIPLLLIGVNFIPDAYKGRFESIFTGQDQEGNSTGARKQILLDGLEVFKEHPFGVGIEAFPKVREQMFGRSQNTHNLYLEIGTNTGFLGLIFFFVFVRKIFSVNSRIQEMLRDRTDFESKFLLALAAAVKGYLWARLFLGLFGMDMYEIYWWYATGLTLANFAISTKITEEARTG